MDLGQPNLVEVKYLLSARDFMALEKLYENRLDQYEKDVQSEGLLTEAYDIFTPENDIKIEDLDLWVARTGSYIAYAAKGQYKAIGVALCEAVNI